jgi:glycosyltransferase involved in cell wall biosynthesis
VEVDAAWLARCWRTVLAAHPAARLLVAGAPLTPERDSQFQAEMSAHLGDTADSVQWLGFVTPAVQAELYARVHCAVFPARPEPLQQAKCSVRLATTLLNGVPVVASAVGEQAAYGADGAAALVPADATPEDFGAAVNRLLADAAEQTAMPVRATARLTDVYAWARLGDTLAAFYADILATRNTR